MNKEQQPKSGTRARILDAAERLLETTSSQSFKVSDVASEAGVSPSLVIQYFNTKDDLVFEASLQRLTRVVPEIYTPYLSANGSLDVWHYFRTAFERDLGRRHLTVDLMSLSWRWNPSQEQRLVAVLAPRLEALREMLHAHPNGKHMDERTREVTAQAALDLYVAVLRRACVHNRSPEDALDELRTLLSGVAPLASGAA